MSEPMRDPMRRQRTSGRRLTPAALLPGAPRPSTETSIPGYLCEVCLDAPAVAVVPAPWGGEMGICTACAAPPPAGPPEDERHQLARLAVRQGMLTTRQRARQWTTARRPAPGEE
jgi:hypothetical protein